MNEINRRYSSCTISLELDTKSLVMKKLLLLLSSTLLLGSTVATAQNSYSKAVGLRFGSAMYENLNFSYKTFISRPAAFELNVGLASRKHWFGLSVAGSYQYHLPITNNFAWYVGAGLSVGQIFSDRDYITSTYFGLFPTLGLDLKIRELPLNLSLDIRPTFYLARGDNFESSYPRNLGLAIRYTF